MLGVCKGNKLIGTNETIEIPNSRWGGILVVQNQGADIEPFVLDVQYHIAFTNSAPSGKGVEVYRSTDGGNIIIKNLKPAVTVGYNYMSAI